MASRLSTAALLAAAALTLATPATFVSARGGERGRAAGASTSTPPARALELRYRPAGAPADGSGDVVLGTLPADLDPVEAPATALDAVLHGALRGEGGFSAGPVAR